MGDTSLSTGFDLKAGFLTVEIEIYYNINDFYLYRDNKSMICTSNDVIFTIMTDIKNNTRTGKTTVNFTMNHTDG